MLQKQPIELDTIFMNSGNSKTSVSHRLLLNLSDKINLKKDFFFLLNLSIYYTSNNFKMSYKNIKFKMSAPTWNEGFYLPGGSYSVSDIQEYLSISSKNTRQLLRILQ